MNRVLPAALAAWLTLGGLAAPTGTWAQAAGAEAGAGAELAAANAARDRGDYAAAIGHYRRSLHDDPQSYEAKFQLARLLSYGRERDEAIRLYTELLATRPTNSDLLLGRGRTYAWEGRWAESEADLRTVTSLLPDYGEGWAALGDLYLWSGRTMDAVAAYSRWVSVEPTAPEPYLARARAYRSRSQGGRPGDLRWLAHVGDTYSSFSAGRSAWSEYDANVRWYFPHGSLAAESLVAERFSLTDHAFALDGYSDAWSRAYLNLRYQYAPNATLYPQYSYRAELFQGVGRGWEPSLSYDYMSFTRSTVDMYGVGLGKYLGNWYLRWRTLLIPSSTGSGVSHRAIARYYYSGTADDYVELNGGFAHGSELLPHSVLVDVTSSWTLGAQVQKFFTPRWGLWFTASVSDERTSNPFLERDASLRLLVRW